MAKHPVSGISGVLGGLISSSPSAAKESGRLSETAQGASGELKTRDQASPAPRRMATRLGRPPGRSRTEAIRREKVTLRIDATLIDDYRDWSWTKRCQLGELVEQALCNYRRSR